MSQSTKTHKQTVKIAIEYGHLRCFKILPQNYQVAIDALRTALLVLQTGQ